MSSSSLAADAFQLAYKKKNNKKLFTSMESKMDLEALQNYVPLYPKFFVLNEQNFDSINLNHKYHLGTIDQATDYNRFVARIKDQDDVQQTVNIFCKFSPLVDVPKFLSGHYAPDILEHGLPSLASSDKLHAKFTEPNNMSYVDSFFCYLSSQLLHQHNFVHGIDFYGSFLGFKRHAMFNLIDDVEYLQDEPYFQENLGKMFHMDAKDIQQYINHNTRHRKQPLQLHDEEVAPNALELDDIEMLSEQLDFIVVNNTAPPAEDAELTVDYEMVPRQTDRSSSATPDDDNADSSSYCSSRSSNTTVLSGDEADDGDEADSANEADANSGDEQFEDANSDMSCDEVLDDDEACNVKIDKFPVQVIALEQCEGTLHSLFLNGGVSQMTDEHWDSIVLQILMTLITYEKAFDMTHNDLHTNNIMFVRTAEEYLYYEYQRQVYKVPTFGFVLKIIDFGRAIYKFKGQTMMSDSYERDGDAYSMYNCEPFFNPKKPRLEPNPSVDLCRLGCALYDIIVDVAPEDPAQRSPIINIILDWCLDDKFRNVLYKSDGEERYPNFKLYKMMARTVHHHTPQAVLANPYFNKYILQGKKLSKFRVHGLPRTYMNIDAVPVYT